MQKYKKLIIDATSGKQIEYELEGEKVLVFMLEKLNLQNKTPSLQIMGIFQALGDNVKDLFSNDCNSIRDLLMDAKAIMDSNKAPFNIYNLFEASIYDLRWAVDKLGLEKELEDTFKEELEITL